MPRLLLRKPGPRAAARSAEVVYALHAAPAAAAYRFYQQRCADSVARASSASSTESTEPPGATGHLRALGFGARAKFVADRFDLLGGRADERSRPRFRKGAPARARSERKPYPGWMASHFVASAA